MPNVIYKNESNTEIYSIWTHHVYALTNHCKMHDLTNKLVLAT